VKLAIPETEYQSEWTSPGLTWLGSSRRGDLVKPVLAATPNSAKTGAKPKERLAETRRQKSEISRQERTALRLR
jgi:hypothetical protein